MKNAAKFFEYARERQQILLRRQAGKDPPWTNDPILRKYRFCCVFREDDRTTRWFRENVRDPMNKKRDPRLLLATVVFRMFNRIETAEAIFCDDNLLGEYSAFDAFSERGDTRILRRSILKRLGNRGPFVTGSYIISTPPGHSKLDGVLAIIKRFYSGMEEFELGAGVMDTVGWRGEEGATAILGLNSGAITLEETWNWLRKFDYLGTFHSYEIVTDLRHTYLLNRAPDIMTWCNPGPGCRRGLNRVIGRALGERVRREQILSEMGELLRVSRINKYWPQKWQSWEMRDVEHQLCEWDKYERTRLGEGRPRGVFR